MSGKILQSILEISTMIFSIISMIYAQSTMNLGFAYLAVFILFIHNIIYSFKNSESKIVYILFHITFFLFLLSRIFVRYIDGEIYAPFTDKVNMHIALSLYISLFFVFLGMACFIIFKGKKYINFMVTNNGYLNSSQEYIIALRFVSKVLMYISLFALFLRKLELVFLMQATSYAEWRLTYSTSLPILIIRISNIYYLCLCVYLATLPTKKKCIIPIFCFILTGVITMFYGIRGDL